VSDDPLDGLDDFEKKHPSVLTLEDCVEISRAVNDGYAAVGQEAPRAKVDEAIAWAEEVTALDAVFRAVTNGKLLMRYDEEKGDWVFARREKAA
jgi:hypothetical protein